MRLPTEQERKQLLNFHVARTYNNPSDEEIADEKMYIDNMHICVFEDYITDGPGYAGRLMVVVWGGDPAYTEVFIWRKNKIKKVEIEV